MNEQVIYLETQTAAARPAIGSGLSGGIPQGMTHAAKGWTRPTLESSIIQGFRKLGPDRTDYELWRGEMDNALEQLRPGVWITLMKSLTIDSQQMAYPYTERGV